VVIWSKAVFETHTFVHLSSVSVLLCVRMKEIMHTNVNLKIRRQENDLDDLNLDENNIKMNLTEI
jgi:hypothetical protein